MAFNLNHQKLLNALVAGGLITGAAIADKKTGHVKKFIAPGAFLLGWWMLANLLERRSTKLVDVKNSAFVAVGALVALIIFVKKSRPNLTNLKSLKFVMTALWLWVGLSTSWHLDGIWKFAGLAAGGAAVVSTLNNKNVNVSLLAGSFVAMAILVSMK